MKVPLPEDVKPSPPPPPAKNKEYQKLSMIAEEIVPKTWWRDAFADEKLLLTRNDRDLPRKQFDTSRVRNKKLKNMLQCVTRQQFIRKSYDFDRAGELDAQAASKCTAMAEPVVKSFLALWNTADASTMFGGEMKRTESGTMLWTPKEAGDGKLLVSALEVLDHFYSQYGGVWTGCFKMEKSPACRGALAGNQLNAAPISCLTYLIIQ
jgi:hypothetical protein